jgi:hypothetical protein
VKLNKHYSNNLSFLIAYTYAKNIDNGPAPFDLGANHQAPQNPFDLASEVADSNTDIRHNLVGSFDYGLPFGHGRTFLSDSKGWEEYVFGGWQFNGIVTAHTGLPYNIVQNGNNKNYPGLRVDEVGDPTLSHPTVGPGGQYFNPAAFALPPCPKTDPNYPNCFGDLGRNAFSGPGFVNFDGSLFKNFPVRERMTLQFRFEVFNVTNTPSFDNPNTDFTQKSTFGKITGTASSARQIQFALKLNF